MPKWKRDQWFQFQAQLFDRIMEVTRNKNDDYTGGTDDPFSNFRLAEEIGLSTMDGLILRLLDKVQRVKAFCTRKHLRVPGEGLEDAFIDIIGYSSLALGILAEEKEIGDLDAQHGD